MAAKPTQAPQLSSIESSEMVDISHLYDGRYHSSRGHRYLSPTIEAASDPAALPASEEIVHRDALGRITKRTQDLARYISPTYGKPIRILVQATRTAFSSPQGQWRRTKLKGRGYTSLRLSVWAVGDNKKLPKEPRDIALMILRILLITPVQIFLLLFNLLDSRGSFPTGEKYFDFRSRSWDYPKYARNPLDASPLSNPMVTCGESGHKAEYDISGDQQRLLIPRKLVILKDGVWTISDGTAQPYIVISYASRHFKSVKIGGDGQQLSTISEGVENIARRMAAEANVEAYWIDYKCRASEQPELTDDVHRICDVFRGARQVCVVLPNLSIESKRFWGQRMWCLPEALLSSRKKLKFCSSEGSEEWTKLELAANVWTDGEPARLLAEHYTGLLTLSRLELISLGLEALAYRRDMESEWTPGDVAYALMSLLHYRPRMNPSDNLFQALARLSLANDSDRIIERLTCMLPDATKTYHSAFVLEDVLGAKLWDIEPLCQVAGVGEGNEYFLDGCQGASIRWKDIPNIRLVGRKTWKKFYASVALRTGPIWFFIGILMLAAGNPNGHALLGFGSISFLIGTFLIFASPWTVQTMYGGKVWGATPRLFGFEGVLPLREVERHIFGNATGRLSYAPSSGALCVREPWERIGKGPAWLEQSGDGKGEGESEDDLGPTIPDGHRLFTLIDTGPSMMVHLFSAAMPPSVALVCGKEGGMLRVVLCSYERATNCFHKETVLRMETPMLDLTHLHGWLKIA